MIVILGLKNEANASVAKVKDCNSSTIQDDATEGFSIFYKLIKNLILIVLIACVNILALPFTGPVKGSPIETQSAQHDCLIFCVIIQQK